MTMKPSRRDFLIRSAALSSASALSPVVMNLMAIGQASAASPPHDYKALVCIFLDGGNDHYNTLVPFDSKSFELYKACRPNICLEKKGLLPLPVIRNVEDGRVSQYAMNPNLSGLKKLFDDKKLAVLLNAGAMLGPISKENLASADLPSKLFSHNDQRDFIQSLEDEGAQSGWGGRLSQSLYKDMTIGDNQKYFSTLMVTGGESGGYVFTDVAEGTDWSALQPFSISNSGTATPFNGFGLPVDSGVVEAVAAPKNLPSDTNPLLLDYIAVTRRAHNAHNVLSKHLQTNAVEDELLKGNPLVKTLRMVARVIQARADLRLQRQVFFVVLPGFDTHSDLSATHPALLKTLSEGMSDFYQQTVKLGVEDQVTTFTASDFGRNWGNDDGSDHGWGTHHFVMGGAVKGGQFYGTPPHITGRNEGKDNYKNGILIPSTSIDQIGATLAAWMGVDQSQVTKVFPRLVNFNKHDLGFMMTESAMPVAGKTYVISARHSGLALAIESINKTNGTSVVQKSFDLKDTSQRWRLDPVPDGFILTNIASGLVLDVSGHINITGKPANLLGDGQQIYQWARHGRPNQVFRIERADKNSGFHLVATHSGKVVDVRGAQTQVGVPLIQWDKHGGENQRFSFSEVAP